MTDPAAITARLRDNPVRHATARPGRLHPPLGRHGRRPASCGRGRSAERPAVVLLAGFPQTWWAWRKVMPDLADRFHVIAIDLPGQGHSERPHGSYDTHTVAAYVHAAVKAPRSFDILAGRPPQHQPRGSPSPSR